MTTGCSISGLELPSNAQVIESSSDSHYLGTVDFSYTLKQQYNFSHLRLYVAQNVANSHVTLRDSSSSWVGAYIGTYYQSNNRQQVAGPPNIFKLINEKNSTLIA